MRQLDLFAERTLHVVRARRALRDFDLAAACEEFRATLADFPSDSAARQELECASVLLARRDHLAQQRGDMLGAVLALHWLLGGDLEQGERSLRATLARDPGNARARAAHGDALYRLGDVGGARVEYARAFAERPDGVALERIADPEVAALGAAAACEYEVDGDPVFWVAAVGAVEGIFDVPPPTLPGLADEPTAPGLLFYRAMAEHRAARTHAERVAIRERMRRLSPTLFARYLERRR
ncbi:MAG: hypothetical protein E6J68_08760 [Deltaproteobacteria bacterium]|nr:MAG: hypothetical protein E6J68_08760 [Deltaproteobacteria bacterium]